MSKYTDTVISNTYEPIHSSAYKPIPYHICVITAANEYQAQGYREQIKWRKDRGILPEETEFVVYPDPHGKRIGSGGSTIYVLYKLLEQWVEQVSSASHELFKGKRILILHSGGDSRRLPAYSTVGKLFIPLPASRGTLPRALCMDGLVTLFDLFFNNLMGLPCQTDGQVVVASGDVLLSFDTSEVAFSDSGVTGVAYPGPVEVASNHGVYVASQNWPGENLREVVDFLQKPTRDELKRCSGLDAADRAFIDTGIMNFAPDAVGILMESSGVYPENGKVLIEEHSLCRDLIDAKVQLDIYEEIPYAMLGKFDSPEDLSDSLQQIPFSVCLLPYCEFFHVGASKHLIHNFHTLNYTASMYGFQNFSKTKVRDASVLKDAFVYNSLIDTDSINAKGPSLIESCYLEGEIQLGGENILTGIPRGAGDISLQEGVCVTCISVNRPESASPSQRGWVSVVYGIEDSFKGLAEDDGTTFLNKIFADWIKDKGISPADLWVDDEPHDLWNARLFAFSPSPAESMGIALSLQDNYNWRQSLRMSLKEIVQSVDYERYLNNCSNLCREINLENLAVVLTPKSDLSSEAILSWCKEPGDYDRAVKTTLAMIEGSHDLLFRARLYKLLSSILQRAQAAGYSVELSSIQYEDKAFELIREAIVQGIIEQGNNSISPKINIRSDEVVWVCAPVRLDFAGGWSDTPPYCLEHGGIVLNAAVKLNGQYPIQAIGKLHSEPSIRITSIDLGEHVIINDISQLLSYQDPSEWSSLPKAAFIAAGLIPYAGTWHKSHIPSPLMREGQDGGDSNNSIFSPFVKVSHGGFETNVSLNDILKQLGSGIDLNLFSAVPAGSGLGTSSILGSAIIACLSRIFGQELTHEDLFNRTLYMEQLMTTGGGWQDQIGGVVGGIKLIQTTPGLFQVPSISWTDLDSESGQCLLYYTGMRRMAKNILRNIVGKYLDRDATVLQTIDRLREKSFEMKEELDHRNIDAFGKKIAEVWELNKTLDPGTSNEDIEAILDRISHLIYGAKLLGAGGGGFLFIVAKGVKESQRVRQILTTDGGAPNPRARFFGFDVEPAGLRVNVL